VITPPNQAQTYTDVAFCLSAGGDRPTRLIAVPYRHSTGGLPETVGTEKGSFSPLMPMHDYNV